MKEIFRSLFLLFFIFYCNSVYGSEQEKAPYKIFGDQALANFLNSEKTRVEDADRARNNFWVPPKNEFETESDYQARVYNLKQKYNNQYSGILNNNLLVLANDLSAVELGQYDMSKECFNKIVYDNPVRIGKIQYDYRSSEIVKRFLNDWVIVNENIPKIYLIVYDVRCEPARAKRLRANQSNLRCEIWFT